MKAKKTISKEKLEIVDTKIKSYHALKTNKSKMTMRYWSDLLKDRRHPDETLLINMEMSNGFHRTFLIRNRTGDFVFKKKVYIIDNQLKYFNIDSKLYQLDYHENLTVPVRRIIPIENIKKNIKAANIIPMQSINPSLIESYLQSKLLESLMKGGQFVESLKKFSFFLVIIMAVVIIHLLLFIYGSGMLNNLKIPGF